MRVSSVSPGVSAVSDVLKLTRDIAVRVSSVRHVVPRVGSSSRFGPDEWCLCSSPLVWSVGVCGLVFSYDFRVR